MQAAASWAMTALGCALLAAAALPAQAQRERDRQTIEYGNLDLVPRGSRVFQTGTRVYGRLDLAVQRSTTTAPADDCQRDVATGRRWGLGAGSRNRIGVRSEETLDRGWRAYGQLEHSLANEEGAAGTTCPFWDGVALVGVGRRGIGWLEAGRRLQPAHAAARLADPWAGDSALASLDLRLYLAPARRLRTDRALTVGTPPEEPWRATLQASVDSAAPQAAGALLEWQAGNGWQLAAGAQRWQAGEWVMPVAVRLDAGPLALMVGASRGRIDGARAEALALGAQWQEFSGAHPRSWRLGAAATRSDGTPVRRFLSAGMEQPWSRRTAWHAELGLEQPSGGAARLSPGVGLRHVFAL